MSLILIIFYFAIGIQVAYILVLGTVILRHKYPESNKNKLGISIIIAARNEANNLNQILSDLANQAYPNFEVIIVNDRSSDDSGSILEKYADDYHWLRVIHIGTLPSGWTGKKYAIHQGVSNAKKEILLFTDADCRPKSKHWLSNVSQSFDSQIDVVLGYSPYFKENSLLNQFIQYETLLTGMQYLGMSLVGKPYMGVGRNMAIRKEVYDLEFLKKIKHLEGGDDDLMVSHLSNKMNTRVMISPESMMVSIPKSDFSSYLTQKVRHLAAGKHYHKKDQTLLGIFTLSCVVVWALLISLLISGIDPKLALMVFGIRSFVVYPIISLLGRKLNISIDFWALPFLDLCYCLYYPLVAVKALATKQVEWK